MRIVTPIVLLICCALAACTGSSDRSEDERLVVANEMIDAWNTLEWDRMFDLFADDGVLHSVMIDPIVGKDVIRERLTPLVEGVERIELQVRNIGIVNDVVMFERVDDFVYKGKHSRVPVVGVMEISGGKIDEWREYYDKASLTAALTASEEAGDSVESEILALTTKLATDWNGGGMNAYLAAYSEDVEMSLLFANRAITNKEDLTELFTSSWTTEEAMGDFETREVAVRSIAPVTAVAHGVFEHRFPNETVHGAFSHVWQKNNAGAWKIIHEHTSRARDE